MAKKDEVAALSVRTTTEIVTSVPPSTLLKALIGAGLIPAVPPETNVQMYLEDELGEALILTASQPLQVRWQTQTVE